MKKTNLLIFGLMVSLLLAFPTAASAAGANNLEKIIHDFKLGEKVRADYLNPPQKLASGYTKYEGQVGITSIVIFVSPNNEVIEKVFVKAYGKNEDWLGVILLNFDKPNDKENVSEFKSYRYKNEKYTWEYIVFNTPNNDKPYTSFSYELNAAK